jgi:hypothetical protein
MVKVITALRRDLFDLVFDKTRDSGFQEEKYESHLLTLSWSKDDIKEILNSRVKEIYRRQYTSQDVDFSDVFPKIKTGGGISPLDYIVERTLFRPRDAIQFANECFKMSFDRPKISWRGLYAAEANYSSKRLKSLWEEWSEYYPALENTIEILRGITTPFSRSIISEKRFEDACIELHDIDKNDPCINLIKILYKPGSKLSESDVVSHILMAFYHVGLIGIKISTLDTFIWSHVDQPRISKGEMKRTNQIKIHKMFRHALEIKDSKNQAFV